MRNGGLLYLDPDIPQSGTVMYLTLKSAGVGKFNLWINPRGGHMASHQIAVMPDGWLDWLKNRDTLHLCAWARRPMQADVA